MTARRGGRPGRGTFGQSMSAAGPMPRATLQLDDGLALTDLRQQLADAGCPNPVERASELVLTGRTRYYRAAGGDRDEAVVDVTLGQPT